MCHSQHMATLAGAPPARSRWATASAAGLQPRLQLRADLQHALRRCVRRLHLPHGQGRLQASLPPRCRAPVAACHPAKDGSAVLTTACDGLAPAVSLRDGWSKPDPALTPCLPHMLQVQPEGVVPQEQAAEDQCGSRRPQHQIPVHELGSLQLHQSSAPQPHLHRVHALRCRQLPLSFDLTLCTSPYANACCTDMLLRGIEGGALDDLLLRPFHDASA